MDCRCCNFSPARSVILRRYEFFKYGGEYDPETHEALPEGGDSNPEGNDLGIYLGAQNAAANLVDGPIAPVPVPSSVLLLISGLGGLGLLKRRAKK